MAETFLRLRIKKEELARLISLRPSRHNESAKLIHKKRYRHSVLPCVIRLFLRTSVTASEFRRYDLSSFLRIVVEISYYNIRMDENL